jgi:predicted RNA-binding Zn ribbon-like protein
VTSSIAPPPELEQLRAFVNTRDIEADTDALAGADHGVRWLRDQELLGPADTLEPGDVERLIGFRETIREALAANHDASEMPPHVRDELNEAMRRARLGPEIEARGVAIRTSAVGVDGAVGTLMIPMLEAMTSGIWERLKVCNNDGCRWAFYDRSRSKGRRWCSMSVCGNRAKQEAWRASRQLGAAGASRSGSDSAR